MKKIAKLFIATLGLASIATSLFAASRAKGPDFENTLSSDIVNLYPNPGWASFAGLNNNTKVELFSTKVDAEIDVSFAFKVTYNDTYQFASLGDEAHNADFSLNHWYIEYRPTERVTFGLNPQIYPNGAFLPVAGTYVQASNLGSSLDVVIRPIDGLRIAGGLDFLSFFGSNNKGHYGYPLLNFGADYTYGKQFSIGLSLRNIINSGRSIGVYASYSGFDNLDLFASYSYNDKAGIGHIRGKNLLTAGAKYTINKLKLAADLATVFGEENARDIYIGAMIGYNITKDFSVGASAETALDFAAKAGNLLIINPHFDYSINSNHSVGAGFKATIDTHNDKNHEVKLNFPIYWKVAL